VKTVKEAADVIMEKAAEAKDGVGVVAEDIKEKAEDFEFEAFDEETAKEEPSAEETPATEEISSEETIAATEE